MTDYGFGTNSGVGANMDLELLNGYSATAAPARYYTGTDITVPAGGDPDVHTDKVYSVPFIWGSSTEPAVIGYSSLNIRYISNLALTALFGNVYANGVIQDEVGNSWRLLYMWGGAFAVREV